MWKVVGEAAKDPEVMKSFRRLRRQYRMVADKLVERLLVEGAAQGVSLEDIERLIVPARRETFMIGIVVELIVCLRPKPE